MKEPKSCKIIGELNLHVLAARRWFQHFGRLVCAMLYAFRFGLGRRGESLKTICETQYVCVNLGFPAPKVPEVRDLCYRGLVFVEKGRESLEIQKELVPVNIHSSGSRECHLMVQLNLVGARDHEVNLETAAPATLVDVCWCLPEEFSDISFEVMKGLLEACIIDARC